MGPIWQSGEFAQVESCDRWIPAQEQSREDAERDYCLCQGASCIYETPLWKRWACFLPPLWDGEHNHHLYPKLSLFRGESWIDWSLSFKICILFKISVISKNHIPPVGHSIVDGEGPSVVHWAYVMPSIASWHGLCSLDLGLAVLHGLLVAHCPDTVTNSFTSFSTLSAASIPRKHFAKLL